MAMTLPMASPSPAPQSPSSVDGSNGPATPVSPSTVQTLALPPPVDATPAAANAHSAAPAATQPKRKPSRRANTAERRATHNAVERARRETLNGRFLDLAALLPNLSQIRRPSKSSIVNSSIAHIHASRRHRLLAARELRMLKLECDALRRELNEWRDRSGLPRVEEPVRGEGFQMIMSGEVEILSAGPIEEEDGDEYGNDGYDDDFAPTQQPVVPGMADDAEGMRRPMAHQAMMKDTGNPFAHGAPTHGHPGLHLQTILPRPGNASSPMIVQSPTNVNFENPAMASMYDAPHVPQFYMGAAVGRHDSESKWAMYGGQQQQQFTPPASSHGLVPGQQAGGQPYMMNLPRQQLYQSQSGHMYGSPIDNDDASSVGSAGQSPIPGAGSGGPNHAMKRERSGSMGSVGSSGSQPGSYEVPTVLGGGMGRRMGPAAGSWEENMGMHGGMGPMGGLGGMGMGGRGAQAAMSVGGGNAYGAMML
ncbi:hypothetical protein PHLGIDRAFT_38191 [Phlebiopsis gigantea 11061_1 CR5-6]|uniref:BHLH domain-containing protein n=1 Tax=Phlebiopsis gigantea (strain 11061_1 CR5-6) TaxID=745531 RepID=A0A0C3RQ21_PHLG1|nr:hypothetical protein PHLGIDRAFT_38191 [Phlebiopsis gigantea 11061_1 CR5-6]